jgi:catechol 2,3-dioxygenase-like lactoylglutathione lyase family enzyme
MFDHVTLRVADLAEAARVLDSVLAPLAMQRTASGETVAAWGDVSLAQAREDRPVTRRLHVAFVAPSRDEVHDFWQAGVDAGLRDNGRPGPRPNYSDDYYGAFLLDAEDNNLEAVHRNELRQGGNVDHVTIRVADVAAAQAFYGIVGEAAGFRLLRERTGAATFGGGRSGGLLSVVSGPVTENAHMAFPGDDDAIRRFYDRTTAAGHRGNGAPGERPRYHPGYYAAFVLDPDGNNIEIVDHHRT